MLQYKLYLFGLVGFYAAHYLANMLSISCTSTHKRKSLVKCNGSKYIVQFKRSKWDSKQFNHISLCTVKAMIIMIIPLKYDHGLQFINSNLASHFNEQRIMWHADDWWVFVCYHWVMLREWNILHNLSSNRWLQSCPMWPWRSTFNMFDILRVTARGEGSCSSKCIETWRQMFQYSQ